MATTPLKTMLSYCERAFAGTTATVWLRKLVEALQGNIDAGGGGGGVTDGDKGDVIVSGGGATWSIDPTVALGNNARVAVRKNSSGATIATRRRLNLIEGSNVTLTISDDGANEEVDVTVAAVVPTVPAWVRQTLNVPAGTGVLEHSEIFLDATATPSSMVAVSLDWHGDSDENSAELLDIAAISAAPGSSTVTIDVAFSGPTSGPIKILYQVS